MTDRQRQRCRARLRAHITRAGGAAKVAASTGLAEITIRQWCMDSEKYWLPSLESLATLHRTTGLDLNKLVAN